MAVTDKRKAVLNYIRDTILGIPNGSDPYVNTIVTKKRTFRGPEQLNKGEFPAVFVMDDILNLYHPLTANEITTGDSIADLTRGMGIGLVGYVKQGSSKSDGALSDLCNDLRRDLIIAMYSDTTLGGNCLNVLLISDLHSIEYTESEGIGVIVQTYIVKYDFNPQATNQSV